LAGLAHLLAPLNVALFTLGVMAAGSETVAPGDRMGWLRASCADLPGVTVTGVCCDVPVDFSSEFVWAAQVAVMRAALEGNERPPVDAVVSSELYGDELAARLGAEHVSVDLGRINLRVSARFAPTWRAAGMTRATTCTC
jgi:HTH-type transcriptional regulator, transcriptional repressor of NAD biosynthesis genes